MRTLVLLISTALLIPVSMNDVLAHCDTLDGPVVLAAASALDRGDPTAVLRWVRKEDEQEIRDAFRIALAVRKQGGESRQLADRYFFETLVRVHRAGEGAPYTGLKPAGSVDPGIAAADQALERGAVEPLAAEISDAVREGIRARFRETLEKKARAGNSVGEGRAFVEAYVAYIHFVEEIHALLARGAGHPHGEEAGH